MDNDPENQLKKKEIQQKLENFKIKNVKQIDDLIYEHGYDIEIGYEKRSLLHYACIVEFDAELVELLVKEGVDELKLAL
ncbi:ankyrin repeat-containing protein [Anaeramoeba ignava]|uniref:Ankyrin repeat-containing protein n=1 Tax=Anaeramoeba ignava TaxID=1746090 RepID=A0A9Q0RAM9_ANAIG|nr:ankyrin repeat-containing protein [Anaeramoeba ignava]